MQVSINVLKAFYRDLPLMVNGIFLLDKTSMQTVLVELYSMSVQILIESRLSDILSGQNVTPQCLTPYFCLC